MIYWDLRIYLANPGLTTRVCQVNLLFVRSLEFEERTAMSVA